MTTTLEAEVKLACGDLDRIRKAGFGLTLAEPRHFEDNWLLDSPDKLLLKRGAALRVRSAAGRSWVTYKGPVQARESMVKVREEIEAETSAAEPIVELFERLGFRRAFRYQKYRTGYTLKSDNFVLKVVLDETPIGDFIEIEGDERGVLRVIEASGFSSVDVVYESYPELQASRCKKRGVPLEDMVFNED